MTSDRGYDLGIYSPLERYARSCGVPLTFLRLKSGLLGRLYTNIATLNNALICPECWDKNKIVDSRFCALSEVVAGVRAM